MKRIFHHYERLEEHAARMWRVLPAGDERDGAITRAAALMADADAFREAMARAVREWPYSCEHNLSARSMNRRAWLGHAGCCLGADSPEETTRTAWHTLTQHQQDAADQAALSVIAEWEDAYVKEIIRARKATESAAVLQAGMPAPHP